MAILAAFNSPEVEIVGLTSIYGNVPTSMATRNAITLCALAGRVDVSTVLPGRAHRLGGYTTPGCGIRAAGMLWHTPSCRAEQPLLHSVARRSRAQ